MGLRIILGIYLRNGFKYSNYFFLMDSYIICRNCFIIYFWFISIFCREELFFEIYGGKEDDVIGIKGLVLWCILKY